MILSLYSFITTIFMISLFTIVFVIVTNFNGMIRRIPLWAVYTFLTLTGIRLLISPVEIPRLSYEIESYTMIQINDFLRYEPFFGGGEDYSFSVKSILVVVWISGIFVRLISLCIKYCHFQTAVKQFIKVEDKHILDTVNIICHKLDIKSIPEIYMTTDNCSPSEYGLFRQKIVLNSIQYTDEEMYYILLHEITHHKLKNDIAKCFAKMLEIIFWWNPVVYLLYDRIDKLMEIYTDLSITKNLNQTQKYEYLKCLCSVYKTININSISTTAFASPVIGRVKESEIVKRFKIAAKGIKNNVSVCIFAVALILVCNFSTFRFVYQPYYDAPFQGILYVQIDFNHSNSYIVKEGADCPKTNNLILRVKLLHIISVLCHLSCQSQ